MSYTVRIERAAGKAFDRLPPVTKQRIAAALFAKQFGYPVAPEVMAKMLRDHPTMRGEPGNNGHKADSTTSQKPAYEKYDEARKATREQEQKHIAELINRWYPGLPREDAYRKIHGGLNNAIGIKKKENATNEQIKLRCRLIIEAVASMSKPAWL